MTPVEIITLVVRILTVLVQFITLGVLWYSEHKWEREKKKFYEDTDSAYVRLYFDTERGETDD